MKKLCMVYVLMAYFSVCGYEDAKNISPANASQETCIDVVIPACKKDLRTLDDVIDGIRKNGIGVRRIIVVSDSPLTDKAEWFDEKLYPVSKKAIEDIISTVVLHGQRYDGKRTGWIFQQFLKLYALFVIPDIADNVLVLDADTIFLRPVSFIDEEGNALYNVGDEHCKAYFIHAAKLLANNKITKIFPEYSGICHHMLFQRKVMTDLFNEIENAQGKPLWQALLVNVDPATLPFSCMSEYEIYFNYIFGRKYPVKIRKLHWENSKWSSQVVQLEKSQGFYYVSCHTYLI
jgi:hypothetical protein